MKAIIFLSILFSSWAHGKGLVVVSAGNSTCKEKKRFNATLPTAHDTYYFNKIQALRENTPLIVTCFFNLRHEVNVWSWKAPEMEMVMNYRQLRRYIWDLYQMGEFDHLSLVGYSHGGWLAMKMAWELPDDIPRSFMLTVDPISRNDCHWKDDQAPTQQELPLGREGMSALELSKFKECWDWPQDFAPVLPQLREQFRDWRNFYQYKSLWLHSGPIPQVENTRLYVYHTQIFEQAQVWDLLGQLLEVYHP